MSAEQKRLNGKVGIIRDAIFVFLGSFLALSSIVCAINHRAMNWDETIWILPAAIGVTICAVVLKWGEQIDGR